MEIVNFLFKWMHLLFGIAWIGLLYYFNFVQTEYFKEATPEGLADAKAKLAPRALAWFRWAAMFTFLTGVILLGGLPHMSSGFNEWIILGATLGTLMFLNVWLVIWPNQKVVLGLAEGDAAAAAPKAALASRTNTLFSGPMAFFMLASPHLAYLVVPDGIGIGLWISLGIIALLQLNALFGKPGPIASIRGVIHVSIALAALLFCLVLFL